MKVDNKLCCNNGNKVILSRFYEIRKLNFKSINFHILSYILIFSKNVIFYIK